MLGDDLTTNLNERSTPLRTLCWALWEIDRIVVIDTLERMSDNIPNIEVIYPANYDRDYTIVDAMKAVSQPEIVGILDDPNLSNSVRPFAEAFFANIAAIMEQVEEVGIDEVEHIELPYPDIDQTADAFYSAHADECVFL